MENSRSAALVVAFMEADRSPRHQGGIAGGAGVSPLDALEVLTGLEECGRVFTYWDEPPLPMYRLRRRIVPGRTWPHRGLDPLPATAPGDVVTVGHPAPPSNATVGGMYVFWHGDSTRFGADLAAATGYVEQCAGLGGMWRTWPGGPPVPVPGGQGVTVQYLGADGRICPLSVFWRRPA